MPIAIPDRRGRRRIGPAALPPPALALAVLLIPATAAAAEPAAGGASEALAELIGEAAEVEIPTRAAAEYATAAAAYGDLLRRLEGIDRGELGPADAIDGELLEAHLRTRLFEIEELRLHELVPVRYLALSATSGLFVRPCGASDSAVREAAEELERLPEILANGRANRILSFGGADYGPTVAGRISGYYVLTPLEAWLSPAERSSRLKAYNPYWTHVISYHE